MPRSFAITSSTPSTVLSSAGQAEFIFTVSNALGRPARVRAVLEPQSPLQRGWLNVVGDAERDLAPDGTQSYVVKVSVPPGTPAGAYSFHLVVVNVANPDEEFAIGPSVGIQVPRAALPPKKKFPVWAVLLAAGLAVITVGAILVGRVLRDEEPGVGGSGSGPAVFLSLQGRSAYVDLGQPAALGFTGPITVEAWIRPRSNEGLQNIVAHGYTQSPLGEFFFRILRGQYQVGSWNGVDHSVSSPMPAEDVGQWVHLAGVYDGAAWRLYRNGQEVASNTDPTGVLPVNAPWAIGARGGGSERFFHGDLAEVRLWSVARKPEQLREDMHRAPKSDEPGLVGYWPLSEGRGTLAKDFSRSEAHGVLREATWSPP